MAEACEGSELDTFLSCVHVGTFGSLSERGTTVSKFRFSQPHGCIGMEVKGHNPEVDEDGDMLLPRRDQYISIEHAMSTTMQDVGLQVWRGALIMADYLLHISSQLRGTTILELGGGSGLVSIVAALLSAEMVICTDIGENVLDLCQRNIERNLEGSALEGRVLVRELDWSKPFHSECSKYTWSKLDLRKLDNLDFILAADVVYDDSLTDSLISCLLHLCARHTSLPPTILISLEKRINFTLEDLAPVAPPHRHFMHCLSESHTLPSGNRVKLMAELVPIDHLPQYFKYERVKELELWKIWLQSDVITPVSTACR